MKAERKGFRKYCINFYTLFLKTVSLPIFLADYFQKSTGQEYGVGLVAKLSLLGRMVRNKKKINTASDVLEHLTMATRILNIPKSLEGSVVECGCFKGGSTANLSLVCKLCRRDLEVFDSFAGLPEPTENDKAHATVDLQKVDVYTQGAYCGTLPEVKENISRWGEIGVCRFYEGYFEKTMPLFQKNCVLVFLDVDLRKSVEDCLKTLWPLLQDGCALFTHEAQHLGLAALFFDKEWWQKNLHADPPGLVGAGCGLGLLPRRGGYKSSLGYTIKER